MTTWKLTLAATLAALGLTAATAPAQVTIGRNGVGFTNPSGAGIYVPSTGGGVVVGAPGQGAYTVGGSRGTYYTAPNNYYGNTANGYSSYYTPAYNNAGYAQPVYTSPTQTWTNTPSYYQSGSTPYYNGTRTYVAPATGRAYYRR